MSTIRAIEVGYGTCSVVVAESDGQPVVKTFPSVVANVLRNSDLSAGLSKRDTVQVEIDGELFEVGNDAHLISDRASSRVLSSSYIASPQYRALLIGSLAMMDTLTIDLLVLALPVNNLQRSQELKAMALGKHNLPCGKEVNVKDVWVICQPLAGYIYYATTLGAEKYARVKEQNVLSIDCGFTTVDWVCSRGLKVNEKKSGAIDAGMSAILEGCQKVLVEAFPRLGHVQLDIIDAAFWKSPGVIEVAGKEYPFPLCEGKLKDGTETHVRFDLRGSIAQVAKNAIQAIQNSVRNGAEISRIIVMGGSHGAYLEQIKEAYPDHDIVVIDNPLTAVCLGMFYGGKQLIEQRKAAGVAA